MRPYRYRTFVCFFLGLALGAASLALRADEARADEDLRADYNGQFVHLLLRGTFAQYTVERGPLGSGEFSQLEFNETGCTSQCTYEDFAIYHGGAYDYRIRVLLPDGTTRTFGPTSVTISPEVGLRLSSRASPNPVRPRTRISWVVPATIAQTGTVRTAVTIHDPAGREVNRLWQETVPVGEYSVAWDGRDGQGRELPAGSYFYRVQAGPRAEVGRLVLLK